MACASRVMSAQTLRDLWLSGPEGRLCAQEQARAWALREVWQAEGNAVYGLLPFVASRVKTTAAGKPVGHCPSKAALAKFFARVDADAEWFPGKVYGETRGRKRVLRGAKRTAVVAAAKRLKAEGDEPTGTLLRACSTGTRISCGTTERA